MTRMTIIVSLLVAVVSLAGVTTMVAGDATVYVDFAKLIRVSQTTTTLQVRHLSDRML